MNTFIAMLAGFIIALFLAGMVALWQKRRQHDQFLVDDPLKRLEHDGQ